MSLNIPSLESGPVRPQKQFSIPDHQLTSPQRAVRDIIRNMLVIQPDTPLPANDPCDATNEEEPALAA